RHGFRRRRHILLVTRHSRLHESAHRIGHNLRRRRRWSRLSALSIFNDNRRSHFLVLRLCSCRHTANHPSRYDRAQLRPIHPRLPIKPPAPGSILRPLVSPQLHPPRRGVSIAAPHFTSISTPHAFSALL